MIMGPAMSQEALRYTKTELRARILPVACAPVRSKGGTDSATVIVAKKSARVPLIRRCLSLYSYSSNDHDDAGGN